MIAIANHLWQSTLFAGVVALVTLALRQNHAHTRHWLWMLASVKFLVPFTLLVTLGSQFEWRSATAPSAPAMYAMEDLNQSTTPAAVTVRATDDERRSSVPLGAASLLWALWFCGCAAISIRWCVRWRRVAAMLRQGRAVQISATRVQGDPRRPGGLPHIVCSPSAMEPGVFGIFRPILLLPDGIVERLSSTELQAVLAHEFCHIRRRDNLAAALHMLVEALFWFHPLVWWMGARLVEERERACDEEVVLLGSDPETYAESILKVCRFCLESPLPCISGITGADLKLRIESILTSRAVRQLGLAKKLLITALCITAVGLPLAIGLLHAPLRAQSNGARPSFEVASVKRSPFGVAENRVIDPTEGKLRIRQKSLVECILWAWQINPKELSAPEWMEGDQFDIDAKADKPVPVDQLRLMLQTLLEQRFKLTYHREKKVLSVYELVVDKGGPRLKEVPGPPIKGFHMDYEGGIYTIGITTGMPDFADRLRMFLDDRPILDRTGLSGVYEIKLKVELDPAQYAKLPDPGQVFNGFGMTPGIFAAVERLGLKLESRKDPVDFLVVDHADRVPLDNFTQTQTQTAAPLAFDVVSVKPLNQSWLQIAPIRSGGRVTWHTDLAYIISYAFHLQGWRISGPIPGSDCVYAIDATTNPSATEDQVRLMFQSLLAGRFKMVAHRVTKDADGYALSVAKGGSKLKEAKADGPAPDMPEWLHQVSPVDVEGKVVATIEAAGIGNLTGRRVSMPQLTESLQRVLQKMVVDQTELNGKYYFALRFALEEHPDDVLLPSLSSLLQDELGLRLEKHKGPVEMLVVDHIEKTPTGN